ncbi:MAG: DUF4831 family protein [Prevotella sp.]
MIKTLVLGTALTLFTSASAQTMISKYRPGQTTEGAVYYLPKTALRISVLVEKTTYTPGELSQYARKYLSLQDVKGESETSHRVLSLGLTSFAQPDTAKCFAVKFNAKSNASNMVIGDDGILLALNALPSTVTQPRTFEPAKRKEPTNPKALLNADILSAGSTAKMAELVAQEIYDIRESKSLLTKGQADFMPKDGEQLRLMLQQLDEQDEALTSMFKGTIRKDTTEHILTYCPVPGTDKEVLFRLSMQRGLIDSDDLSGAPYYICIDNLNTVPSEAEKNARNKKKKEEEDGIYVNVPGKIKVSILKGTKPMGSFELHAAQYGYTELLSGDLFNKKYTTRVILNPTTGAVNKLEAEQPK